MRNQSVISVIFLKVCQLVSTVELLQLAEVKALDSFILVRLQKSGEARECAAWMLCANERTFSKKCAVNVMFFYLNPSLLPENDGKDQKTIIAIVAFILGRQPAD